MVYVENFIDIFKYILIYHYLTEKYINEPRYILIYRYIIKKYRIIIDKLKYILYNLYLHFIEQLKYISDYLYSYIYIYQYTTKKYEIIIKKLKYILIF